jgi:hypothetical protein
MKMLTGTLPTMAASDDAIVSGNTRKENESHQTTGHQCTKAFHSRTCPMLTNMISEKNNLLELAKHPCENEECRYH